MFLSSFENKIDKKGRVSVPATFRSYLNTLGYNGFISYPSFNHSALEACSQDRIEKLSSTIDSLNPFEEKRDYFATSVLSESESHQKNCLNTRKLKIMYCSLDLERLFKFGNQQILKSSNYLQEKKLFKIDLT
jgi:hypothetical protein